MDQIPDCPICKTRTRPLYRDLEDGLYGVPGRYHFSRCPACRLIRLDNPPDREAILACYENYYTRAMPPEAPEAPPVRRFGRLRDSLRTAILCSRFGYRDGHRQHSLCRLGPLMSMVPGLRRRAVYDGLRESFPAFPNRTDNLLIDVGCGRGDFLARMKSLGWNVQGIEPDPVASELARSRGIAVFNGRLEEAGLAGGVADQVTLNHVLEHVEAPADLLKECRRILRPGGRLVIYTPNAESLGHRWFGKDWRGLEPPRHLFVFSPQALRRILEGAPFRSFRMKTPTTLAGGIYDYSVRIRREGATPLYGGEPENGRVLFRGMERLLCLSGQYRGEEIEVVARREAG
jgi:2-polyprenyl-3-methyl-5-hydroxy-6-metoxy-1,4-benzoquinol methylase